MIYLAWSKHAEIAEDISIGLGKSARKKSVKPSHIFPGNIDWTLTASGM